MLYWILQRCGPRQWDASGTFTHIQPLLAVLDKDTSVVLVGCRPPNVTETNKTDAMERKH